MSVSDSLKIASDIHKHVRKRLRDSSILQHGTKLIDIANFIETETKEYTATILDSINGLVTVPLYSCINGGIGFPVGLSVNDCAAHYHPHSLDRDVILSNSDILKVDFGTEINGWIIDSAFTYHVCDNEKTTNATTSKLKYNQNNHLDHHSSPHSFNMDDCESLISCMKDATYLGVKNIGVDGLISDWSSDIEELIRSHDGIHPIYNLTGHDIQHEIIHGNVRLPSVFNAVANKNERFKEGVYAIETFGARLPKCQEQKQERKPMDNVEVDERGEATIFRLNPDLAKYTTRDLQSHFRSPIFRIPSVQKTFSQICKRFKTLPFCERYMQPSDRTQIAILSKNGAIMSYPPLCCTRGSITAQFEHTVYVKDYTTVFSRDDDY
jgi:methionyl aminopeptidase